MGGGGGSHVALLNFKTFRVGVYKIACCLLLALPSLSQFGRGRLSLVAVLFYVLSLLFGLMSLVGIYPGRASVMVQFYPRSNFPI